MTVPALVAAGGIRVLGLVQRDPGLRGAAQGRHDGQSLVQALFMVAAQLSDAGVRASQEADVMLKHMYDAVRRADTIVRGLLDFSSIKELDMRPENVNAVIEKALVILKHELDKNHVRAVTALADNLTPVSCDINKMEQVLVNLVLNAVHAMPAGGDVTIRTYMSVLSEPGGKVGRRGNDVFRLGERAVIVEIEDNGEGIAPEVLSKIFDPFFTTRRGKGGTGLGLSVVKSIIDMHKADIRIANKKQMSGVLVTLILKG